MKWSFVSVHVETLIDASKETVWEILSDFPSYGDWNPNNPRVTGALKPGERVRFAADVLGAKFDLDGVIDVVEPGRELRWTGPWSRLLRLRFCGEHRFRIEELG